MEYKYAAIAESVEKVDVGEITLQRLVTVAALFFILRDRVRVAIIATLRWRSEQHSSLLRDFCLIGTKML